mmetsp:Transcript_6895/g.28271  ORF Transcript_6895/g.28271 Transcript_6895/m.28271 type:complete len:213 (-) Transcript_6895:382-1020(-)
MSARDVRLCSFALYATFRRFDVSTSYSTWDDASASSRARFRFDDSRVSRLELRHENLAHLHAPHLRAPLGHDIPRAVPVVQAVAHRLLDLRRGLLLAELVAQHHRRAEHLRQRVRLVLPGDVRRGAVHGLVQPRPVGADGGGGEHADGAGEHGRGVGQDVSEDVTGDDGVELRGRADDLHRRVVHVHVRQLDVGILLFVHARHDFFPQLRNL